MSSLYVFFLPKPCSYYRQISDDKSLCFYVKIALICIIVNINYAQRDVKRSTIRSAMKVTSFNGNIQI